MRALRFTEFGDPDVLLVMDLPDPSGTRAEAVIRVEAASVKLSDVKNVAGAMDWTVLPRTLGRDFAGRVVIRP
jgi:NADPH:quinone reductase-like Zn-dependent oxidoreductase